MGSHSSFAAVQLETCGSFRNKNHTVRCVTCTHRHTHTLVILLIMLVLLQYNSSSSCVSGTDTRSDLWMNALRVARVARVCVCYSRTGTGSGERVLEWNPFMPRKRAVHCVLVSVCSRVWYAHAAQEDAMKYVRINNRLRSTCYGRENV